MEFEETFVLILSAIQFYIFDEKTKTRSFAI